MNDDKTKSELERIFAAGESWLRQYGVVQNNAIVHNNIVLNLYTNFPKAKYVEYFIPTDETKREMTVVLYFSAWHLLFKNRDKIIDDVIDLINQYLHDYTVRVELRRFSKKQKDKILNES